MVKQDRPYDADRCKELLYLMDVEEAIIRKAKETMKALNEERRDRLDYLAHAVNHVRYGDELGDIEIDSVLLEKLKGTTKD